MLEPIIKSPCCENRNAKLFTEKRKHIIKQNVYEGSFYVYKCDECGLGWTTTESDTVSLNNLKPKKL
jgi:rubrerythrin